MFKFVSHLSELKLLESLSNIQTDVKSRSIISSIVLISIFQQASFLNLDLNLARNYQREFLGKGQESTP